VALLRLRQRGQRGGVAVRVLRHVRLDLGAEIGGDVQLGRIGDRGRVLLEPHGLVPARGKRRRLRRGFVDDFLHAIALSHLRTED
jgi:hypothetical protein